MGGGGLPGDLPEGGGVAHGNPAESMCVLFSFHTLIIMGRGAWHVGSK